jgi:hypothetical protein
MYVIMKFFPDEIQNKILSYTISPQPENLLEEIRIVARQRYLIKIGYRGLVRGIGLRDISMFICEIENMIRISTYRRLRAMMHLRHEGF